MLRFVWLKIKNKKILTLCLVMGLSFLVAAFCCQPMYKDGALSRLLYKSFQDYIARNNQYPTVVHQMGEVKIRETGQADDIFEQMQKNREIWENAIGDVPVIAAQQMMMTSDITAIRGYVGAGGNQIYYDENHSNRVNLVIGCMPELSEHANFLERTEDCAPGVYPCYVTPKTMENKNLSIGMIIRLDNFAGKSGEIPMVQVMGVFEENAVDDLFWYEAPATFEEHVFLEKESFCKLTDQYNVEAVTFSQHVLFDYHKVTVSNIEKTQQYLEMLCQNDDTVSHSFAPIFALFAKEKQSVGITLLVLDLPLLGMVLAFIYMVSGQIVEYEKNEIAMLSGRGVSRWQVFQIYVVQSLILAGVSLVSGTILGLLFGYLAAATTDFFVFDFSALHYYKPVPMMLVYSLIALMIGMVFVLIPVIGASKVSITTRKSEVIKDKKPFWEKCYLDIALTVVSLYLWYNFWSNRDNLRISALSGNGVDPAPFLDAVLFMLAAGLFMMRLTHYLILLLYKISYRRLSPVGYASFLQIIRTRAKQGFISVFLILSISLGLFYANTARTINDNNTKRIVYDTGCDLVFAENWQPIIVRKPDFTKDYKFAEPEYGRFQDLLSKGIVEKMTKVIMNKTTLLTFENKTLDSCQFYAIHTKEFGECAYLQDGLNGGTHWYHALNALSQLPNGAIISQNAAKELGIAEGDFITLQKKGEIEGFEKVDKGMASLQVAAIVDDFPGYERYTYDEANEMTEQYLIVANYQTSVTAFGISPYQIWCKLAEGMDAGSVNDYLREHGIVPVTFENIAWRIEEMKGEPNIQITNGMFTMGFFISIILCAVGFLIYWITSIKQRELLFGVYRAMGLSSAEVCQMLVHEHVYSTFLSIVTGIGVGGLTTLLFGRIFGIIYLPKKHNIEITTVIGRSDAIKLFCIVFVMIGTCLFILMRFVRKQKITDALKLGEE